MSYAGRIEELIAERDELRATLTTVSDALDYLHGMTPQQAADVRKDAERYRWLRKATELDDTVLQRGPGAELDATIDAAMLAAPAVGAA